MSMGNSREWIKLYLDEINLAYEALERAEDGRGVIVFD